MDSLESTSGALSHNIFNSLAKPLELLFKLGEKLYTPFRAALFNTELIELFGEFLNLFLTAAHKHTVTVDNIIYLVIALFCLLRFPFGLMIVVADLIIAAFGIFNIGCNGGEALGYLLRSVGELGKSCSVACGVLICLILGSNKAAQFLSVDITFRSKSFCLTLGGANIQLLFSRFGVNSGNSLSMSLCLRAYALRSFGLLVNFAVEALNGLLIMAEIGFQNSNCVFAFGGGNLLFAEALALTLGVHIALAHFAAEIIVGGIELVQLPLCAGKLNIGLFKVLCCSLALFTAGIQLFHPDVYLQLALLIAEDKKLLCGFSLLFEGNHLHLQFVYLIVDADKVFVCAGELALRLLLAVTVAGNSRGFLKNLAAVGALCGNNLCNASLTYNAVAVTAETRIHKKSRDVLQSYGLTVYIIFTFAVSVITAGNSYLGGINFKCAA